MTLDNETHTGYGFAVGMLCGVAVGAALGLLFAPTDGRELRHKIGDSAKRLGSQSRETYEGAKRAVNDVVSAGREAFHKTRTETAVAGTEM